jgi:hypothetical protein
MPGLRALTPKSLKSLLKSLFEGLLSWIVSERRQRRPRSGREGNRERGRAEKGRRV